MSRAVVYARVSSEEQAASGLGVEAQTHACRGWAGNERRAVVGPFVDDGVGGATGLERRPALLDAVARLEPGDVLLVAKRDRLGRDPLVIAMIEAAVARKNCRIASAAGEGTESDDPSAVLMRRMVDAFAEYERLIIKARTKAALSAKARRGERTGQVPLGSALAGDGRTLEPDAAELAAIDDIFRWRSRGWTLRAIADELTRRNVPTKNGSPRWSHTTVSHILRHRESRHREDRQEEGPGPAQRAGGSAA